MGTEPVLAPWLACLASKTDSLTSLIKIPGAGIRAFEFCAYTQPPGSRLTHVGHRRLANSTNGKDDFGNLLVLQHNFHRAVI